MNHRLCRLPALCACAAVILSGCGGNPPRQDVRQVQQKPAGDFFVGTQPVYARLVNERGGSWIFTDVLASDAALESGFLVRLNDLTPAFDTRVAECMPQVYPDAHRCSTMHPFRNKHAGVIDKIISGSIAVGTAGKVSDISQSYETRFDAAAFNRAVDEALVNTGLKSDRRRLIELLESYEARYADAHSELSTSAEQVAALRGDADSLLIDVRPSVEGLTQYYEGDLDFRELLTVETAEGADATKVRLQRDTVLPCKVRECLPRAEAATARLQQQVREQQTRLAAVLRPASASYKVSCEQTILNGYLLSAECPDEISVSGPGPVVVPIRVTILSRDFDDLYPPFELSDEQLRVEVNESTIRFANTTSEYLTLTAQTLYYNSQVNTTARLIDIPPGITVTRDIREFVSQPVDIESTYRQMTPDKALGAEFQFGLAVRYRVASQGEEHTLHDRRTFNVGCVISNRIQPGSCRSESLADTNAPSLRQGPAERRVVGPM